MKITNATQSYEQWLARHTALIAKDLRYKHERMAQSSFEFLRATFYRWVQNWDLSCGDFARETPVLAVGDLHLENFGTWRDVDGRMIWGVNDFDETARLPFVFDLIRLATSSVLATESRHFHLNLEDAVEAVLDGYELGLIRRGAPFVLEENHTWLRGIALNELREPSVFWKKMRGLEPVSPRKLSSARTALHTQLPKEVKVQYYHRIAGLGSLGRPRFVAIGDWRGGLICREAKHLAPSAVHWARGSKADAVKTSEMLKQAVRVPDPFYHVSGSWLVRRLAPHCSKIEIENLLKKRYEFELLLSMGFETANIHLGSQKPGVLRAALNRQKRKWIRRAVERMADLTLEDWSEWRSQRPKT